MNYNNNLNMRDLKKNLEAVRLPNIMESVAKAEINKEHRDLAAKGSVTKMYINSEHLNPEELSLLVDAAPRGVHKDGHVVCTWILGPQFTSENEGQLNELLTVKLKGDVEKLFQQRTALAKDGAPTNPEPLKAQSEGLVSRFLGKLSRPKHQESSFGLG